MFITIYWLCKLNRRQWP